MKDPHSFIRQGVAGAAVTAANASSYCFFSVNTEKHPTIIPILSSNEMQSITVIFILIR